jgi:phospholipid/cholesterol/gamma-HCH transport system ATP-binding protein
MDGTKRRCVSQRRGLQGISALRAAGRALMETAAHTEADANQRVIEISKVSTHFGDNVVHSELDLDVRRREIFAVIGGSGSGKSTLLREMILLHRPDSGSIRVLGADLQQLGDDEALALRRRWGVMFQHGGLFGSLTVKENIGLPLREHTGLADALIDEIAAWKLAMTGLEPEAGAKYPSELSGGMLKRASLARALALDPELLFLDEPTAGLDPDSAGGVDQLVLKLRDLFGLTIVMITHDLDLLWQVADRVAVLAEGKVQGIGSMSELSRMDNPAVRQFFDGPRGRAAQEPEKLQAGGKASETIEGPSSKPK